MAPAALFDPFGESLAAGPIIWRRQPGLIGFFTCDFRACDFLDQYYQFKTTEPVSPDHG
jgi:hypothetical protein